MTFHLVEFLVTQIWVPNESYEMTVFSQHQMLHISRTVLRLLWNTCGPDRALRTWTLLQTWEWFWGRWGKKKNMRICRFDHLGWTTFLLLTSFVQLHLSLQMQNSWKVHQKTCQGTTKRFCSLESCSQHLIKTTLPLKEVCCDFRKQLPKPEGKHEFPWAQEKCVYTHTHTYTHPHTPPHTSPQHV